MYEHFHARIINKEVINYYNKGMSAEEISEKLNISKASVLSRIRKIPKENRR